MTTFVEEIILAFATLIITLTGGANIEVIRDSEVGGILVNFTGDNSFWNCPHSMDDETCYLIIQTGP